MNVKRVLKDLHELNGHPLREQGIYYIPLEDHLDQGMALLIGPTETPYEGGFYQLAISIPENYPYDPPTLRFKTSDPEGRVRFHPNLYTDELVCLSIINTWKGPSWTPVQSIQSVLL